MNEPSPTPETTPTTGSPQKVVFTDSDFDQAPLFRNLHLLHSDYVVLTESGATINTSEHGSRPMDRAEFDRRYETHPSDPELYQSKESGRGRRGPGAYIDAYGKEIPVPEHAIAFRSNLDRTIAVYPDNDFNRDFARQLADGSTIRLSALPIVQLHAIRAAKDSAHLDDLRAIDPSIDLRLSAEELAGTAFRAATDIGATVVDAATKQFARAGEQLHSAIARVNPGLAANLTGEQLTKHLDEGLAAMDKGVQAAQETVQRNLGAALKRGKGVMDWLAGKGGPKKTDDAEP